MILTGHAHLEQLAAPLGALAADVDRLDAWGGQLAAVLSGGGRALAVGNGGSAAQAQHLVTELVGRYRCAERAPLSALALCADTTTVTALGNDFGIEELFARQVRAHGRPGDVLIALSTSGGSANVVRAAETAREVGLAVWALTGPAPNELAARADDALCVDVDHTPTVQEIHLIAIHLLCAAVDAELSPSAPIRARSSGTDGLTLASKGAV